MVLPVKFDNYDGKLLCKQLSISRCAVKINDGWTLGILPNLSRRAIQPFAVTPFFSFDGS